MRRTVSMPDSQFGNINKGDIADLMRKLRAIQDAKRGAPPSKGRFAPVAPVEIEFEHSGASDSAARRFNSAMRSCWRSDRSCSVSLSNRVRDRTVRPHARPKHVIPDTQWPP